MAREWNEAGLIDEAVFRDLACSGALPAPSFRLLFSRKNYVLSPVADQREPLAPRDKADALAFAVALRESRRIAPLASFHDAVYVERFSRLLPSLTPLNRPPVYDGVILGMYLTGGVAVSINSFEKLARLAGFIPVSDLVEIIEAAGLQVPAEAEAFIKRKAATAETQAAVLPETAASDRPSRQKVFRLPGRSKLEGFFNEHVVDIVLNAEKYKALGIGFPSAIVLYGPPGCGKTFAVRQLVEFLGWSEYSIDSSTVGSPYIHDTARKISKVFDMALNDAPSVLIIDEMESFLSNRGDKAGQYHVEEVAEFLRRIPEASNNGVLVIGMTNMIDAIDPAVLRRGRFDHVVEVEMPSREEVTSLLSALFDGVPKDEDFDLSVATDVLTGRALSDAAFFAREAARLAARAGKSSVDMGSVEAAMKNIPDEKKKRPVGF
jgi:hypothetical protein